MDSHKQAFNIKKKIHPTCSWPNRCFNLMKGVKGGSQRGSRSGCRSSASEVSEIKGQRSLVIIGIGHHDPGLVDTSLR